MKIEYKGKEQDWRGGITIYMFWVDDKYYSVNECGPMSDVMRADGTIVLRSDPDGMLIDALKVTDAMRMEGF